MRCIHLWWMMKSECVPVTLKRCHADLEQSLVRIKFTHHSLRLTKHQRLRHQLSSFTTMLAAFRRATTGKGGIRFLHSTAGVSATPAQAEAGPSTVAKWTPQSIRTGLIARKRGMLAMFDQHGAKFPVTVLQVRSLRIQSSLNK